MGYSEVCGSLRTKHLLQPREGLWLRSRNNCVDVVSPPRECFFCWSALLAQEVQDATPFIYCCYHKVTHTNYPCQHRRHAQVIGIAPPFPLPQLHSISTTCAPSVAPAQVATLLTYPSHPRCPSGPPCVFSPLSLRLSLAILVAGAVPTDVRISRGAHAVIRTARRGSFAMRRHSSRGTCRHAGRPRGKKGTSIWGVERSGRDNFTTRKTERGQQVRRRHGVAQKSA